MNRCANCGGEIVEKEEYLECPSCGCIYEKEKERSTAKTDVSDIDVRLFSMLNNYSLFLQNNNLIIVKQWRNWLIAIGLTIALILISYILSGILPRGDADRWIIDIILLLLYTTSIYAILGSIINKTTTIVSNTLLTVKERPFPLSIDKQVFSENLIQLYCKRNLFEYRDKHGNKHTRINFELRALTDNHKIIKLGVFDKVVEAQALEKVIESFLQIEDRPVEGEYMSWTKK